MHRSKTVLRKLKKRIAPQAGALDLSHLCDDCQSLQLTDDLLKHIPVSRLPDQSPTLDLLQGFINVSVERREKYPAFSGLKHSAAQGCQLCDELLRGIAYDRQSCPDAWDRHFGQSENADAIISFRYNCTPELGKQSFAAGEWPTMLSTFEMCIRNKAANRSLEAILVIFKVVVEGESPLSTFLRIHWQAIVSMTLRQENIELMNGWVKECCLKHTSCQTENRVVAPTRLVHIGNRETGVLPHLVTASAMPPNTRWAALSYCWGPTGSMRLITTHDTLAQRQRGISYADMPAVFTDALLVTEALGLQYVWIDALCIVQDDASDWKAEAAKMGDVYRMAEVTIVAASSKSTNETFLTRQWPEPGAHMPFRSSKFPQVRGNFTIAFAPSGHVQDFTREVEQSFWNDRGWTFQERLLSRRLICFSSSMLFFECRTHRYAENYSGPLNRKLAIIKHLQNVKEWDVIQMSWRRIIEEYSKRNFTYEKDRLPALAGLAQEMVSSRQKFGQKPQYIAGHWLEGLALDLVWITVLDGPSNKITKVAAHEQDEQLTYASIPTHWYRISRAVTEDHFDTNFDDDPNMGFMNPPDPTAPTWSWCSVGKPVTWLNTNLSWCRPYCEILDTSLSNVTSFLDSGSTENFINIRGLITRYSLKIPTRATESKHRRDAYTCSHSHTLHFEDQTTLYIDFDLDFYFDMTLPNWGGAYWYDRKLRLAFMCEDGNSVYGLILVDANWEDGLAGAGRWSYPLLPTKQI